MHSMFRRSRACAAILCCALLVPAMTARADEDDGTTVTISLAELDGLLADHAALQDEVVRLRASLATAELAAKDARRETEDLRAFIADHEAYGDAFERFRAFQEDAARRRRQADLAERAEARKAEQAIRAEEARERSMAREVADAARQRERELARAGFRSVGTDVYVSQMGFSYRERIVPDSSGSVYVPYYTYFDGGSYYSWNPGYDWRYDRRLDFSAMTISGSILNTSPEVRNIGLAVTFYDEAGAQVGGESIEVASVRPYAPVPFTRELTMAMRRPFYSSSVHVLYADLVDPTEVGRIEP
ncbi:MAG: hypothetical protein KDA25_10365 [Phycisphaerales bacterium]|nr:hypothetical protein [Phycisphaerales bacterium]